MKNVFGKRMVLLVFPLPPKFTAGSHSRVSTNGRLSIAAQPIGRRDVGVALSCNAIPGCALETGGKPHLDASLQL